MTFCIEVTYAAGNTQRHEGLTADQADTGAGAFVHDLTYLDGEGVRRVVIEKEYPRCEAKLYHGPGHQSATPCRVRGPHEIHEAEYRAGLARWRDGQWKPGEPHGITGFFDEPPEDPND